MVQSKYVGVDGCPYGWFSVGLDDRGEWEGKTFLAFGDLLTHYANASLILVDIPIGLPEKGKHAAAIERRESCSIRAGAGVFSLLPPGRQPNERRNVLDLPARPSWTSLDHTG